jgi:hypothetical protein
MRSHLAVRLRIPPTVIMQWLGNHAPLTTNTHTTTKELLDAVSSMRSV